MEFFTNAREVYRKFEPQVSAQPSYKLVQVTKQCTESELLWLISRGALTGYIVCLQLDRPITGVGLITRSLWYLLFCIKVVSLTLTVLL